MRLNSTATADLNSNGLGGEKKDRGKVTGKKKRDREGAEKVTGKKKEKKKKKKGEVEVLEKERRRKKRKRGEKMK